MLLLAVTLTVRRAARAAFYEFEARAAAIMARHGGFIEQAIEVEDDGAGETFREIHIVRFADEAAFAAYRQDPASMALADLRASCIVATEIVPGLAADECG